MSDEDLFARLVSPNTVEQAVVAALSRWMPSYIPALERNEGYEPGTVEPPRGIVTASEFDSWAGDQFPVYLVLSAGTIGKPIRRGDGTWEAAWSIGVAPIVSDVDQGATRRLASAHATAVRAALLQHKALKSDLHPTGFATYVRWEGESYADLPFLATRSLGSMRSIFAIGVEKTVAEYAGPRVPLPNPTTEVPLPPGHIEEVTVGGHPSPLAGAPS